MTATQLRPRRSVLYMPASNERALEKAKSLAVDALILDLEDAVGPDAKDAARENACAAAKSGDYGPRELTIRVNGIGSPWHEKDFEAACAAGPDAIVVPKVNSADEVRSLVAMMERFGVAETTKLWAMIETPAGILNAPEIGCASTRLTTFVIGTNDIYKELGATFVPGRAAVMMALQRIVLAARATGLAVLDGVYNDVKDDSGFRAEAEQGRELGMDGKTLIHPGQVDVANEVFAPNAEAVENARATIEAFESARAQGKFVATLNGRLIENLHVDIAKKTLAMHDAITSR